MSESGGTLKKVKQKDQVTGGCSFKSIVPSPSLRSWVETKTLEKSEGDHAHVWGKITLAEGIPGTNALRAECAWCAKGTAKRECG